MHPSPKSKIQNPNSNITIGMLGSGQLGRMAAIEARRMGYTVHVFSPEPHSPTGQVADHETVADYLDLEAVRAFAQQVDVVTYEFENVPLATATACAEHVPVYPSPHVLATAQNRLREKAFMAENGLPVPPFAPVYRLADLQAGLVALGTPAVLKTAESGYDGKGQVKIHHADEATAAWAAIGQQPAILEAFVPFVQELSVVAARGQQGDFAHYGTIENEHQNHILYRSISPARVPTAVAEQAVAYARIVLECLDVIGVLCVEFFLTADHRLLLNEIAPRPHNSGHLTIESHHTSQFEQQVRAVCGLPLGNPAQRLPAVMLNLLGDVWPAEGEPNWAAIHAIPNLKLHLYGKHTPRPGRKMGHLTAVGHTIEEALTAVAQAERVIGNW